MRRILVLLLIMVPIPAAGGTLIETQAVPSMPTYWSDQPLAFSRCDPSLGTLTSVMLALDVSSRTDFLMSFVGQPATIYLATTQTSDPAILSDPVAVAQLSDGPTATLAGPGGMPLLSETLPVAVKILTARSGTFSSTLPPLDPSYITPALQSGRASLDIVTGDPLLPGFVGTGTFDLLAAATSHSNIIIEGGNGSGALNTVAGVDVTLTYQFTAFVVLEPPGLVLLGVGLFALVALVVGRRHGTMMGAYRGHRSSRDEGATQPGRTLQ